MAARPGFVSEEDWNVLVKYAGQYGTDPYLLAAIGQHETGFGRLGKGKQGYVMGYGVTHPQAYKWQGLEKQAEATAKKLGSTIGQTITPETLYSFAAENWKPDPGLAPKSYEQWSSSVWNIYSNLKSISGGIPSYTKAPVDYAKDPEGTKEAITSGVEATTTGVKDWLSSGWKNIAYVFVTGILMVLVGIGTFMALREGISGGK